MTKKMITKTVLLARSGWSGTLVTRLLGDADQLKKIKKSSITIKYYELERIQLAEASQEFRVAQSGLAKRKEASKIERLLDAIEAMPITVTTLTTTQVVANAIRYYNSRQENRVLDRDDYTPKYANPDSDSLFLERITVNYIRHELSQYDRVLETTAGKTGADRARVAINKRVYALIAPSPRQKTSTSAPSPGQKPSSSAPSPRQKPSSTAPSLQQQKGLSATRQGPSTTSPGQKTSTSAPSPRQKPSTSASPMRQRTSKITPSTRHGPSTIASELRNGPITMASVRKQRTSETASSPRHWPSVSASSLRHGKSTSASVRKQRTSKTASSLRRRPSASASPMRQRPSASASSTRQRPNASASSLRRGTNPSAMTIVAMGISTLSTIPMIGEASPERPTC